ncbi:MAG TPA: cation diffusion facilitator family transporter [Methylibium sp.]|uniref:cation diffusion facilitator family transporter n=1 Tax=Methylibium sp. TaxID=2067992 RepID=UPI002DB71574|nr:cation diffusion facilitator family transporter [Methylibium sp.]HEU4459938.1 cation diffusion facilitator family transporter [Methylibium sp.]
MGAGHNHALPSEGNERSLSIALVLTSAFLVAELAAGLWFNSLALIADAAHMFTDATALAIAVAAIRIARRPADAKRSYGYHRFEILAAAFNALLLLGVAGYILFEAWQRFRAPAEVHSTAMLAVAVLGMIVNLISMRLLRGGSEGSLNVKGAYLEVWSDLLGSIGVIVGAIVIRLTGWNWVDTLVAVGIGLWVLPRTWVLLKESLNVLLEGTPEGIDVDEVVRVMRAVDGVEGVHDLHVWALTSGKNNLTAHVVHAEGVQAAMLINSLQDVLANRFHIQHTTFQLERPACARAADGCVLDESHGHAGAHDDSAHPPGHAHGARGGTA